MIYRLKISDFSDLIIAHNTDNVYLSKILHKTDSSIKAMRVLRPHPDFETLNLIVCLVTGIEILVVENFTTVRHVKLQLQDYSNGQTITFKKINRQLVLVSIDEAIFSVDLELMSITKVLQL